MDIVQGDTYGVLSRSEAALTTSGTATLETALFGVPQVVCYKGNAISFAIARRLVKVPFISLVNLIAGRPVVEELIQDNMNTVKLTRSLNQILEPKMRQAMLKDYEVLHKLLDAGGASKLAAGHIYHAISKTNSNEP